MGLKAREPSCLGVRAQAGIAVAARETGGGRGKLRGRGQRRDAKSAYQAVRVACHSKSGARCGIAMLSPMIGSYRSAPDMLGPHNPA